MKTKTEEKTSSQHSKHLKSIWAIGLMSGTSCDGIDASLIKTNGLEIQEFAENIFIPYDKKFADELKKICQTNHKIAISDLLEIEQEVTMRHAHAVKELIKKTKISEKIELIGFHGQAIFHNPQKHQTCQIGNIHLLAKETSINVIGDFRKADMALGGNGAPLAPLYHEIIIRDLPKPIAVINIGGISNITYFGAKKSDDIAFDIGPGNCLIDDFVNAEFSLECDKNGEIASQGEVQKELLEKWLSDPYFSIKGPKSLDRNYFKAPFNRNYKKEDFLNSLTNFTVMAIFNAMKNLPSQPQICLISGGGRKNKFMFERISNELKKLNIITTNIDEQGLDGDFIESQAFGLLAVKSLYGLPTSQPQFTGAREICTSGSFAKSKTVNS